MLVNLNSFEEKPMKILYMITNADLAGAQVHLLEIVSNFSNHIEIHVIVGDKGWLWERLREYNITMYHVKSLVRSISPANDVSAICETVKIIKKIRPALIHCHSSKAGFLGRIAGKICSIPTVFTAHGWSFTEGIPEHKRMLYRYLEGYAARNLTEKIICVSEYDRRLGLTLFPEKPDKFIAIHNGIADIVRNRKNITSTRENVVKLVMVARFSEQKDHFLLLRAISILKQQGVRFDTILVGDGPLWQRTKQFADSYDLSDDVRFAGAISDVPTILSEQDVFVLTSNWEGLPISILEAMRQSLPVLASDVGGVNEAVVDSKTGFLIPRGNLDCLVNRLKQIAGDKKMRKTMGINGRLYYEEKFSQCCMLNKTQAVYEGILRIKFPSMIISKI